MASKPLPRRYPLVPIQRRIYAFLVDFVTVWFFSGLIGFGLLQFIVFIVTWLILRVYVVYQFRGQSLGRWAFDMVLIDGQRSRLPDLELLSKREGVVSVIAALAMVGVQYGLPNLISLFICLSPSVADLVVALGDQENQQALHDQFFRTVIVPSRRGYSLDLRIRNWVDEFLNRVR